VIAVIDDAESFLKEAKRLILKNYRRFIPREEYDYLHALLDLGFTTKDRAWRALLQIQPSDMSQPPELDHDGSGHYVWFFKREYNGIMAYIKLKIDERGCVCLSFHPDWPDKYKHR
jgi:hypothetical protein